LTQNLLPKNEEKRFALEFSYTISCPIITMVGYEDSLTKDQKSKYQIEAMLNIQNTLEKEEAPDYHVMIYLSQVSLVKPLGRLWTNIYLTLGRKYFKELKDDAKITEIVHDLEEDEQRELTKIKQWVFKKQIELIKSKQSS